jgi:hypothetical protein
MEQLMEDTPLARNLWCLMNESLLLMVWFTYWSPVVDVPVGQFSSMNTHPNLNFDF